LHTQLTGALFAALMLMLVAATSTLNPVAMIPGGSDIDAPVRAVANSVYALSPTFAMSGFFVYPFFAALMAGLSVMRDDEAGLSELLQSTPLTRAEYVWAKCAGVSCAMMIAILAHVLIVVLFREVGFGGVTRGPFSPTAYLIAAALFTVPGVLWCTGLAFAIGARTRAPMAVYALPVALFVLEFMFLWNWHPVGIGRSVDALLMVLDPTGLRWLTYAGFADARDVAFYNSAPLVVDAVLVTGRLVSVALSVLCVAVVAHWPVRQWRVRPRRDSRHEATTQHAMRLQPSTGSSGSFRGLSNLAMQRRAPNVWRATATVLMAELRELSRRPSGYLFAAFLFAVVTEVSGAETDAYGSTAILTAGGIAVNALPAVTVLTCLFLLFVIVESMHRDRATGFDAIALSTPVPTSAFIAGKSLAAVTTFGVFTAVCIISGILLLAAQSESPVHLWPLLLVFGGVLAPTFILWTAFVTAVMSMTRSRTTTLAVGFVALLLTAAQFVRGDTTWVTNWPVLGALRWTDFALFPLDGEALLLNRLTALALSVALFATARSVFARTERDPVAARARRTPAYALALALRALPLAALPLFTGGFLALRVHNGFEGPAATAAAAMYTRTNQPAWGTVTPAVIRHADLTVNLEPVHRRMDVDGWYLMVNHDAAAITRLPFTIPNAFGPVQWWLHGTRADAAVSAGLHVLTLATPLAPGDSLRVGFRYFSTIASGVSQNGSAVDAFILPSSVLLSTHRGDFLPMPGFADRGGASLQPATRTTTLANRANASMAAYFNWGWPFTAVMRVRAPSDLTVNGVGTMGQSHTAEGRTTVTWTTRTPVSALSLVGARYAVRRSRGAAVYYLPKHSSAVGQMLNTLVAAREHYSAWFYRYPWDELRLNEYADMSTQATSYPTNIAFSEGIGFLTRSGPDGGLAFAVTAHEAAHQWWGHLLSAGTGPGSGMLVEGMADYSTLLLYEAQYGLASRTAFATRLEREYLQGRARDREQAVLDTREETAADEVVLQKKGAWAMWMLHNALGAERTFAGLRDFIANHRTPGSFATTEDLLLALRAQARDTATFDALVQRWFRSTELPEFRLRDVQCARAAGSWNCRAQLLNTGTGVATVDVAATYADSALFGGRVRTTIRAGEEMPLRWRLGVRPDRLVVDPDAIVLQLHREQAGVMVP